MSVINTMLQDLERRRVDLGHSGAFRYVRALPEGGEGRQGRTGLILLAGALFAAAFLFGPDLWQKIVRVSSVKAEAAAGRTAPAPAATSTAVVDVSKSSQGLVLTVSRELLGREMPAGEMRSQPPGPSATPAPRALAAQMAAPGPRAVPETRPASESDKTLAVAVGAMPAPLPAGHVPLQQAPSLSIERSTGSDALPNAPGNEIKRVNAQQRNENEFRRGNELLGQGRAPQALEAFAQVLAWDPMHDAARQALVAALLGGKNSAEAERLLIERQSMSPRNAGFALILARLQAERGDNNMALDTLRSGLSAAGSNPSYQATMAALLARLGQHAQAVTYYQAALRLAPQSGVWWMGLGLSLQAVGSLSEAQEALRRARASDNLSPELAVFVDQRLRQLQ